MPLSDDHLYFFISYAVAFAVFGLIARWYLWPALRDGPARTTLPQLLPYASFRVNGLMFLMAVRFPTAAESFRDTDRLWRPDGRRARTAPLWPVRTGNAAPASTIWRFYIVGPLDLIYENFSTFNHHVDPAYLGVSDYFTAVSVPARGLSTFARLPAEARCSMARSPRAGR